MPRGDKSKYTSKQQRQAEHIEDGYEKRGVSKKEAERRAWATENKISGGGKKPGGSGRGKADNKSPARKGGRKRGATKKSGKSASSTKRTAAKKSTAKKTTRKSPTKRKSAAKS